MVLSELEEFKCFFALVHSSNFSSSLSEARPLKPGFFMILSKSLHNHTLIQDRIMPVSRIQKAIFSLQ